MTTATLHLPAVLADLDRTLAAWLDRQVIDVAHPLHGAFIEPDTALAPAFHNGIGQALAAMLLVQASTLPHPAVDLALRDTTLPDRIAAAVAALERMQLPTGRFDLQSCNYDSEPDAAFLLQLLLAVLGHANTHDAPWHAPLLAVLRRAAEGLRHGGYHTPNHRWVVASALAMAQHAFPDFDAGDTIAALRAETIDIDPDGAYIERSSGVYDAVVNRSLMLLHEHAGWSEALHAVAANLRLNSALIHPDGTIDTSLSTRQDVGMRAVPLNLAHGALQHWAATGDNTSAALAATLWQHTPKPGQLVDLVWLAWALLQHTEPDAPPLDLRAPLRCYFPTLRTWRRREGRLSATVHCRPAVLSMCHGPVHLRALRIRQTYFGSAGDFVPTDMQVEGNTIRLDSPGRHAARRPAYDLPLGRAVSHDAWDDALADRPQRPMPAAAMSLMMTVTDTGFDLHLTSAPQATPDVVTVVAFDFEPGPTWHTRDTCFTPQAGQVIILREGPATMRLGTQAITIAPGSAPAPRSAPGNDRTHTVTHPRDMPDAPHHVRVIISLFTPLNHHLHIQATHNPPAEWLPG